MSGPEPSPRRPAPGRRRVPRRRQASTATTVAGPVVDKAASVALPNSEQLLAPQPIHDISTPVTDRAASQNLDHPGPASPARPAPATPLAVFFGLISTLNLSLDPSIPSLPNSNPSNLRLPPTPPNPSPSLVLSFPVFLTTPPRRCGGVVRNRAACGEWKRRAPRPSKLGRSWCGRVTRPRRTTDARRATRASRRACLHAGCSVYDDGLERGRRRSGQDGSRKALPA